MLSKNYNNDQIQMFPLQYSNYSNMACSEKFGIGRGGELKGRASILYTSTEVFVIHEFSSDFSLCPKPVTNNSFDMNFYCTSD